MRKRGEILILLSVIFMLLFALNYASAATRTCYNCTNCSAEINVSISGDITQLNNSITITAGGACIDFGGKDNITFDCQNYFIQGTGISGSYGVYFNSSSGGSNNNTLGNCNIINFYYGIFLATSNLNKIINVTSNNNTYDGLYFSSGNNNTFTNIIANNNFARGFKMDYANYNLFINITANNNLVGIYFDRPSNNTLINITLQENTQQDLGMSDLGGITQTCQNSFQNITGSGGRPIEFYNSTAIIQNKTLSGLILCNASNSIINNVTIQGSDTLNNNFLYFLFTNNTILSNINSSYNYYGIYLDYSSNNTIINITTNINNNTGVFLAYSNNNTLMNIDSINNFQRGVYLYSSLNNNLTNIITNNNSGPASSSYGIYLYSSNNNFLTNIITNNNTGFASSSGYGIYLTSSNNNFLTNITTINNLNYNNQWAIWLVSSSYNTLTNITVTGGSNYYISGVNLDASSNNNLSNILSNNNTTYGIFIRNSNNNRLTNIIANNNSNHGIYLMYNNTNNTFTNITVQENRDYDIYFERGGSSKFSCINNNFTNINGSGGRAIEYYSSPLLIQNKTLSELILCNASYSNINNVTIRSSDIKTNNGLYILFSDNMNISNINSSQNYNGIFLINSYNNTLINTTLNYNRFSGMWLEKSNNNNLINITANNNTQYGLYIPSSNNTFITNATVNNNSQYGIYLGTTYSSVFNNIVSNSILKENGYMDLYLSVAITSSLSSPLSCNNNFTNNIGSGDRAIEYYSNSIGNTIQNKILSELILCNVSYSIINNVTINSSDSLINNGIYMSFSNNMNISNVSSFDNLYGFYSKTSNNVILTNVIANGGGTRGDGLYFEYCNNTIITNLTTNNNYDGTYLYQCLNAIVTNLTSNYNAVRDGLIINGCNNSVFTNIVTNNNTYDGISISGYNNTLMNVITNNNGFIYGGYTGITIYALNGSNLINITANNNNLSGIQMRSSYYNTIRDSYIAGNVGYGLYLYSTASVNNLFYNNYLNNTINYRNNTNMTNFFNTTLTAGTNIVGGANIGGNFWAHPNNTGFSQLASTCADANSDGICDSAYNLDGLNYDYLPLMLLASQTTEGENETGGTPSGGGSLPPTTNQTFNPNTPTEILINNSQLDLTKIIINVLEAVSGASFSVTKIDIPNINEEIGIASGKLYQAFNITAKGITKEKIANVTIDFKVNKTWLSKNNGTSSDIRLHRKANSSTKWEVLLTTLKNQDDNYYHYSAFSPGFSTFVVFFGKYDCQPGVLRCYSEQTQLCLGNSTWLITEKCKFGCEDGKCIKTAPQSVIIYTLMIAIISVAIIITSYLILTRIFGKKRK